MRTAKPHNAIRTSQILLRILVFLLLYFAFGPLGRFLVLGTWYGLPVWPSAGVALAALLLWGRGYWPCVFLAAGITAWVCLAALVDSESWGELSIAASGAALGATLQAVVGAWLVGRWGRFGRQFDHIYELAWPVLLGVLPVAISAVIGSACFAWSGIMFEEAVPVLIVRWWLAETAGIVLVLPIVSMWKSEVAASGPRTRLAVAVPPLAFLVCVVGLFVYGLHKRQAELAEDFLHTAQQVTLHLQQELDRDIYGLRVMEAFMLSSTEVTSEEFRQFTSAIRIADGAVRAMAWAPHMPEPTGAEAVVGERFPIQFVEPAESWSHLRGLDLGSEGEILEALMAARDSGELVLLPAGATRDGTGFGHTRILAKAYYGPATAPGNVEERQQSFSGFSLCVFKVAGVFAKSIAEAQSSHVAISVVEESPSGRAPLFTSTEAPTEESTLPQVDFRGLGGPPKLDYVRTIPVANREWRIEIAPEERFYGTVPSRTAEAVMLGGVLIVWLLSAVLMVLAGRNTRAERLVRERTAALQQEIEERAAVEQQRLKVIRELEEALSAIRTLEGLLPICASCKKIRDDKGYWTQIEAYLSRHSRAEFTHGICPDCIKKLYPDYSLEEDLLQ